MRGRTSLGREDLKKGLKLAVWNEIRFKSEDLSISNYKEVVQGSVERDSCWVVSFQVAISM